MQKSFDRITPFNEPIKFLIPKEFGGGFIKDKYQDYGYLGTKENGEPKYDMYELLAFWNKAEGLKYNGEFPSMKERDEFTDHNRSLGIYIGCYDEQKLKLKYPLKLVSCKVKPIFDVVSNVSYQRACSTDCKLRPASLPLLIPQLR